MGHMGNTAALRREMHEAFMAIVDQDAHVLTMRAYKAIAEAVKVQASVAFQRSTTGATGIQSKSVPVARMIATRKVDNPMLTPAEQQAQWQRELERAERQSRQPRYDVSKTDATENTLTRIGALAYVRRREPHHEATAELFKSLWEARYGNANPAIDYERVRVDTTIIAHDAGMASKIDRTKRLEIAEGQLSKDAYDCLRTHLVFGVKCEDMADKMPSGQPNQRQVGKYVQRLLDHLDTLEHIWGKHPMARLTA